MEYRVLGASAKNLRAIENALSIKGDGSSIEYPKADFSFKEEISSTEEFLFPFQMSIISTDDGESKLLIREGRVQINDTYEDRVYVFSDPYTELSLNALTKPGTYHVILVIMFDSEQSKPGKYVDGIFYRGYVYFAENATTNTVPQTRGLFSIPIGSIIVNDNNGNISYSIEQEIIGNFNISMGFIKHPYSIYANIDLQDGDLKNNYTYNDFTMNVNGGFVIFNDKLAYADGIIFQPTSNRNYVYLHISFTQSQPSVEIIATEDEHELNGVAGNTDPNEYYIMIGEIYIGNDGIHIVQELASSFSFTLDTYKTKVSEQDDQPNYLSGKFKFAKASLFPTSGYLNSYIGVDLIETTNQNQKNQLLRPTFLYKDINGYDVNKNDLVLGLKSGNLQWTKAAAGGSWELSGCLTNLFELKADPNGVNYLIWQSEFDLGSDNFPYILVENASTGALEEITFNNKDFKQGIFVWNFPETNNIQIAGPDVVVPPNDLTKKYVYAGNPDGFTWMEFQSSSFELSGSIKNIFSLSSVVLPTGEEKNVLYVGPEFNGGFQNEFRWISLESDGTLNHWNFDMSGATGIDSIMCYDNRTKEPQLLHTEDAMQDEFLLLGGDNSNGLYWVPLFSTISSLCLSVAVDENDSDPGFLSEKIEIDESLKGFFKLEIEDSKLVLKSVLEGTGLLALEEGSVKAINAPSNGKFVLVVKDGLFSWEQVSECDTACNEGV